ncbi:glycosyltransferase [Nguyenibacter vanlangensis]|uniref:Glycosyltransferase n=1 Tax=Nguyenibacter vanlangensis TaxID=1216886 RepID=A0ABZ3D826_9PROT
MTDSFSVSVIIPVYNAVSFVERAIGSVLEQSLPAVEILVVDDCSTDATAQVVATLAQRHPSIRPMRAAVNGGPAAARNLGIAQATGDWIAILDADDAYAPDRLEAMARMAAADPDSDILADDLLYYDAGAGMVTGRAIGAAHMQDRTVTPADYLAHNLADGRGADWGLLKPVIRRAFLMKTGLRYPVGQRHGEDFTFMMHLLLEGARFRILDTAHYLYTQREGAVSRRESTMTRTTIAYAALAQSALELTSHPAIKAQPGLDALLRRRAEGLLRLDDAHFFSQAIRKGALAALLTRALHRPSFVPRVGRQIGRAMQRRVARRRSA